MILTPKPTIDERVAAARARLNQLSTGDWSDAMGDSRKLAERQVLYGLLAAVDKDEYREISPVADRVVTLVEDRLK